MCFLIKFIFNISFITLKHQQKLKINKFCNKIKTRTSNTQKFNKINLTIKFEILLGLPPKKLLSLMSLPRHLLQNVLISTKLCSLFKIWISTSFKFPPIHSYSSESQPFNPSDSFLCHLGMHPWADSAWLRQATLPESPNSLKRHWYWSKTKLYLLGMLLAQKTSAHVCLAASYYPP